MAHPVPIEAAVTAARAVLIPDTVVKTQTEYLNTGYRVIYLILLPETGCCEPILTSLKGIYGTQRLGANYY